MPKMSMGVTSSQNPYTVFARPPSFVNPRASRFCPSSLNVLPFRLTKLPQINFRCNSAGNSGENESKTILDAFFLGKAVGETVSERIESAVGEFLSMIGKFQAEQQKQVQEFQEDVLEKARRAKEQATMEAIEAQGLIIPKSTTAGKVSVVNANGVAKNKSSVSGSVTPVDPFLESKPVTEDPQQSN